ncbi:MAG TPA: hypothetical protein VFC78_09315 [Tepidisphaeraceae bacterium]|nr:hypothetical protein [Tepidisphaeraceae bacterium]
MKAAFANQRRRWRFICDSLLGKQSHRARPPVYTEALECRRLLSAGQPDPTFGAAGSESGALFDGGAAQAIALQSDGRIIAAGSTSSYFYNPNFALARFASNGMLDRTFGVNGRVVTNTGSAFGAIEAIAVQADGKIVAAGFAGATYNTQDHFELARYNANGTLDTSFGTGGTVSTSLLATSQAHGVAIEPDGKIVVAGFATDAGGHSSFAVARYTASGSLDSGFGTGGELLTGFANTGGQAFAVALQADGKIVAAGQANGGNGAFVTEIALARYTANGTLDGSFGTGGTVVDAPSNVSIGNAASLAIQSDGKIVVGAAGVTGPDTPNAFVARFLDNGTLDNSFGVSGVASGAVTGGAGNVFPINSSVLVQADGKILAVTQTSAEDGPVTNVSFNVTRFTPSGLLDASYGAGGTVMADLGSNGSAYGAVLQPNGDVVTAGATDLFSGDFAVARFTPSGALDYYFGYHGVVERPDGMTGPIKAVAVQPDGKILAAGSELSTGAGQPTDAALLRYNADGSLDSTFGIDGRMFLRIGNVAAYNALVIEPDGKILVGGSGQVGANSEFALVRYNLDGSADHTLNGTGEVLTRFPVAGDQSISALALTPDNKIVAAGSTMNAFGGFAIARYLSNGALDPTFAYGGLVAGHPNGQQSQATSVAVQSDGKIIEAGQVGSHFGMVRLTTAGKLDPTFGAGGVATASFSSGGTDQINAIAIDPTGRIVAGGNAYHYDPAAPNANITAFALARFSNAGQLDPTFGTGGRLTAQGPGDFYDVINSLALAPDGKIVVGGLASPGYYPSAAMRSAAIRPRLSNPPFVGVLARFTSAGLDSSFAAGGIDAITNYGYLGPTPNIDTVALQADGKIVAGGPGLFRVIGG